MTSRLGHCPFGEFKEIQARFLGKENRGGYVSAYNYEIVPPFFLPICMFVVLLGPAPEFRTVVPSDPADVML